MKEIKLIGLDETVYEYVHKSGLRCFFWSNEKVKSTYMTLSVKYGSIHTDYKIGNKKYHVPNGLAHFLEHVKFNESENTVAHEFFNRMGADANAYTTFDHTNYIVYATTNQKEVLHHLLDFVYNPYFSKKLIQKEKGIITEEANMTFDDVFTDSFFHLLKNIFFESKYKEIITGTPEDIKEISLEHIENVYKHFYHPKNMYLCVTGNVNPYELAKVVDDALEDKTFDEFIKPTLLLPKEPKEVVKNYEEIEMNLVNSRVRYSVKISKSKFKDIDDFTLRLVIDTLLNINFGSTSDFKEDLIKKGLITNIYGSADFLGDYIILLIAADSQYHEEVIKRIEEQLNNLIADEDSIRRKIKGNITTMILEFDDIENVNARLQDYLILYDDIIDDALDKIKGITQELASEIAQRISTQNSSVLIMNPKKEDKQK